MSAKKPYPKLIRTEDGLTLIETLIALAIFSIGILGVAQLQLWNIKNNTTGNITTQATMLARTQLEELKNIGDVTDLTNGADADNPINPDGSAGGIFTRSWTISNPHGGNISRQIQVTVSWNRRGQNRSVILTTITKGNGT
jgi:prepilin-type N-terminal cleavage/methylation domain-containing protein